MNPPVVRDGSLFMGMTGSGKKWPGRKKLWSWNDGLRIFLSQKIEFW